MYLKFALGAIVFTLGLVYVNLLDQTKQTKKPTKMMLGRRLVTGVRACMCTSERLIVRPFTTGESASAAQWNDLTNVTKELRRIAEEEGMRGLPDTKLLKELGHRDLVLAIRKKHGGFVAVASKMGVSVENGDVEIQKKITSRTNRRKKREMRVAKHDFY